jgi:hypothetical protein
VSVVFDIAHPSFSNDPIVQFTQLFKVTQMELFSGLVGFSGFVGFVGFVGLVGLAGLGALSLLP